MGTAGLLASSAQNKMLKSRLLGETSKIIPQNSFKPLRIKLGLQPRLIPYKNAYILNKIFCNYHLRLTGITWYDTSEGIKFLTYTDLNTQNSIKVLAPALLRHFWLLVLAENNKSHGL